MRRGLVPLVVALCAAAYLGLAVFSWAERVWTARHARDFASYYYALQAAADGDDPYRVSELNTRARDEGTRKVCNPFFYPPPFLLVFSWCRPLSLETAYRAFFLADHLFLLAILLALWCWVPHPALVLALAVIAPTFSPIADNDWMGQANLLVLAITVLGLLATERGWEKSGGALVGLACMLKMSPALLVMWWLLHRRWRPAVFACLAAVVLSGLALPLVGFPIQWRFFTEVLPGFGEGAYHALTVPIDLQANHSIPSLLHEILPSGSTIRLSAPAAWISRAISLVLLGALAWRFRRPRPDPVSRLLEVGAVVVLMLILPVYAYEHHMVWLIVPYAAVVAAWTEGRLRTRWAVALVLAFAVSALPLAWLKTLYPELRVLGAARDWVYYPLREAKFLAAILVGVACFVAARFRAPACDGECSPPGSGTTSASG